MIDLPHQASVWRNRLMPLAVLVPGFVAYATYLQITRASVVQATDLTLFNAIVVALTFWGTGTLLVWRRSGQLAARLFFLLMQAIGVGLLFFLAYSTTEVYPVWMSVLRTVGFHLAGALLVHFYLNFPTRLGSPRRQRAIMSVVYGLMLIALAARLTATQAGIQLAFLYNTLEIIAAVIILVYAYRHPATPDDRRRIRSKIVTWL